MSVRRIYRLLLKATKPIFADKHRSFLNGLIDSLALNLQQFHVHANSSLFRAIIRVNPRKAIRMGFQEPMNNLVAAEELDKLFKMLPMILRIVKTVKVIDNYRERTSPKSLLDGALLVSKLNTKGADIEGRAVDDRINACITRMVSEVEAECKLLLKDQSTLRVVDKIKAFNRVRRRKVTVVDDDIFYDLGYKNNNAIVSTIVFCEVLKQMDRTSSSYIVDCIPFPKKFMARITPAADPNAAALSSETSAAPSGSSFSSLSVEALTYGSWISDYPSSAGLQEIKIRYNATEGFLEAIKADGDEYIPKDQITWRFEHLDESEPIPYDTKINGQIQVAREGYTDPVFLSAVFTLRSMESNIGKRPTHSRVAEIVVESQSETDEAFSLRCVQTSDLSRCLISFNANGCAGPVTPSTYVEMIRKVFGSSNSIGTLERAALRVATHNSIIARMSGDISSSLMRAAGTADEQLDDNISSSFYWLNVRKIFETATRSRRKSGDGR